jgi:hypothetical protein
MVNYFSFFILYNLEPILKINGIIYMLNKATIKKQKQKFYGLNQSAMGAGGSPHSHPGKEGWKGSSQTG